MPLRDYRCPRCGVTVEVLEAAGDSSPICSCRENMATKRAITALSAVERDALLAKGYVEMELLVGRPSAFPGADTWRR